MLTQWQNIWSQKYKTSAPTHILDGFDSLSIDEWQNLVTIFCELIGINKKSDILDIGCGAGAFLEAIKEYNSLSGVDYSENAIIKINKNINGKFLVANADSLPFKENIFNKIISFSVFFYFPSMRYAEKTVNEMIRVCKPGGKILIGDLNDADKIGLYNAMREKENRNEKHITKEISLVHLFFDKEFFIKIAEDNKIKIQIIDEDKLDLPFYSSSQYRYSIIYTL